MPRLIEVTDGLCGQIPEACEDDGSRGLQDICKIDPRACPDLCDSSGNCGAAQWAPPVAPCPAWPARDPKPHELGKRDPLADWAFPFNASVGIECGRRPRTGYRRVKPELP